MARPIFLKIHMGALRHNFQRMKKAAAGRDIWCVVKADAYGHGLENAVKAFDEADGLALLEVQEAVRARKCGWAKRILVLEGFFDDEDIDDLIAYDVETVVHSPWMIEKLQKKAAEKFAGTLRCHIKINSGMNRLGFLASEVSEVWDRLAAIDGVEVKGVVTHFANAEPTYTTDGPATVAKQLARIGKYQSMDHGVCLANSAATLFHPEVVGDAVRAGVSLYGVSPDSHITSRELEICPAMSLEAKIIAIQQVEAGEAVGYGSRWIAQRPSRLAVVACGYADGYPRSMPNGAPTFVEGKIAPIAGAVSMDMLEIDVTDIPEAQVGSTVELWGEHIGVNDLAKLCGTIGYELLCSVKPRVRVLVDDQ